MKQVHLKIRRQDSPEDLPYWEEFLVPYQPRQNVVMALQAIRLNPVTAEGIATKPVVWECSCLEEVCGSCTMIINGKVRQACSSLIDKLDQPIVLEPLSKFPTVRDLHVDRSKIFAALKKISAWVVLDGYYDLGEAPQMSFAKQQHAYIFSRCIMCGACLEACPQYNFRSDYLGAHALGQVYLLNLHPLGKINTPQRLESLMGVSGIADCNNSGNCAKVCPKEIPLTEAISSLGWDTNLFAIKKTLRGG
ncbi:MAG: succinate dehydrogenase iron-sulfur subunit [Pseudomonadota bacterium]